MVAASASVSESQDQPWIEHAESDLLCFFEYNGSPLLETTAGETAQALGVPIWQLHEKLKTMVDSGRLYRWDVGTYTFCRTSSRSDTSRYLAAKIGFFRHGRKGIPRSTRHEPEEVDLDVDLDGAEIDWMED